jgi:hypothetical protein
MHPYDRERGARSAPEGLHRGARFGPQRRTFAAKHLQLVSDVAPLGLGIIFAGVQRLAPLAKLCRRSAAEHCLRRSV